MSSKTEKLKKIEEEVSALTTSPLYAYRTEHTYLPVVGEGSENARIMFIGEAPGKNEALSGRPFCGSAGKVLNTLLGQVGIAREDVYITSVVKDRPPENRDPTPEEIALYAPFLDRQIEVIQPRVIATLGRFAMEYVMERYGLEHELKPISEIHGQVFDTPHFKVITLYHPAAAIYNRKLMKTLEEDFKVLAKI